MKTLLLIISVLCMSKVSAQDSFFDLEAINNKNETIKLEKYKNQVVLVVNIASKCGFTPQLKGLQELYEKYKDRNFTVIGFPTNDFKQEDLEGDAITKFCLINYGAKYPIMKKDHVNGPKRHKVYKFLIANSKHPKRGIGWNFEKFLINRQGKVVGRFRSGIEPFDKVLIEAIEKEL